MAYIDTVAWIVFPFVRSDAGDSLNDCRIMFLTEIYKIDEPGSVGDTPAGSESPLKSGFQNVIRL